MGGIHGKVAVCGRLAALALTHTHPHCLPGRPVTTHKLITLIRDTQVADGMPRPQGHGYATEGKRSTMVCSPLLLTGDSSGPRMTQRGKGVVDQPPPQY